MASFCKQCSIEIFTEDFHDLAGLSTPIDTLFNRFPMVLCEECGPTQVDHNGICIHHEFHDNLERSPRDEDDSELPG